MKMILINLCIFLVADVGFFKGGISKFIILPRLCSKCRKTNKTDDQNDVQWFVPSKNRKIEVFLLSKALRKSVRVNALGGIR